MLKVEKCQKVTLRYLYINIKQYNYENTKNIYN